MSARNGPAACELALRWAGRCAGVAHAFCAVFEPERNRLQGVAGMGLTPAAVTKFRVYLDDAKHVLVKALCSAEPVFIAHSRRHPPTPLGTSSLLALPLSPAPEGARGLLLVRSRETRPNAALEWAAYALGLRLASLGEAPFSDAQISREAERRAIDRQGLEKFDDLPGARARFLANMSHELRLPLNSILGYTSMLLRGVAGEVNVGQRKHLHRIDTNAQHLLSLINDLLDVNRLDANRVSLSLERFALAPLLQEVVDSMEPLIVKSGLAVSVHVAAGLPEIRSDRQRVKQILVNLVGNAVKFTNEGSVQIAARHDRRSGWTSISVADTGIGIAADQQSRLFEDFTQLDDSLSRRYGGAGLGLSISRRLAQLLGGAITLSSELGKGSTFTLQLPAQPEGERR